jgi:hypothetical protein
MHHVGGAGIALLATVSVSVSVAASVTGCGPSDD